MGRADGKSVKNEVPMYYLIPHFLTERSDAMNMITIDIPIEPLRAYMNAKRREGRSVSHMAILMTAYTHMAAEFPSLNRFIVNRRIYQRNEFKVSLVVLRPGGGNDDTMSKIEISPKDTVFEVQKKIDDYIALNATAETETGLDKVMRVLCRMNWLMRFAIGVLRWADKHNFLPKFLIDVSPFHASLLITNLASIRTNHIYHHVYNFGTTGIAIAMGNMRDIPKKGRDGQVELVRCMPLGVCMDERIASGHYFALAFARFKELLAKPELLEIPAEEGELCAPRKKK